MQNERLEGPQMLDSWTKCKKHWLQEALKYPETLRGPTA
jgi:hypothetical protein